MSRSKPLGETEKTVVVGALILGFWLGLDALVKQAEKAGATTTTTTTTTTDDPQPCRAASRCTRAVLRPRRERSPGA